VSGAINPADPAAPQIKFHIAMPTVWNNKIMMFGGGGYDGTIPAPTGNVPAGPTTHLTPLGRGYATFASDSGHQANALGSEDGSFGVNDEAVANFSGDALKKTRDAAVYLIDKRYAVKAPKRAYFAGGSSGGREALAVVQRWPQDWDGSIVLYPAWAAASLDLQFGHPGSLQARISQLSGLQDVNKTDLSVFNAKGGKILMAHGMSDALVSTRSTEQYYQRLQTTMGASAVANFVRFYEIPGYGHAVSSVFNAAWDSLTTMENWVENGVMPPEQIVVDAAGVPGRTRPLCEYPTFPRYNGAGDVNAASSFTCATQ
jgi:predicted esterase